MFCQTQPLSNLRVEMFHKKRQPSRCGSLSLQKTGLTSSSCTSSNTISKQKTFAFWQKSRDAQYARHSDFLPKSKEHSNIKMKNTPNSRTIWTPSGGGSSCGKKSCKI